MRPVLLFLRWKIKTSYKVRDFKDAFQKHFPRISHWAANWGWAGLIIFGLTFESLGEYLAGLILFVLSSLSLIATVRHWPGIEDWPKLTKALKGSGIAAALILLVVSVVWTMIVKADRPWSNLSWENLVAAGWPKIPPPSIPMRVPKPPPIAFDKSSSARRGTVKSKPPKIGAVPVLSTESCYQPQSAEPYATCSSMEIKEIAIGFISKISGMLRKWYEKDRELQIAQNADSELPPAEREKRNKEYWGSQRKAEMFFVVSDFKNCCLNDARLLRVALIKKIGPGAGKKSNDYGYEESTWQPSLINLLPIIVILNDLKELVDELPERLH